MAAAAAAASEHTGGQMGFDSRYMSVCTVWSIKIICLRGMVGGNQIPRTAAGIRRASERYKGANSENGSIRQLTTAAAEHHTACVMLWEILKKVVDTRLRLVQNTLLSIALNDFECTTTALRSR